MIASLVRATMVIGLFVAIGCAWSLVFVRRGTAEFVVAVFGVGLGVLITVVCAGLARRDIRRSMNKEEV